jgi:long-chain acyl-CoA synthetase
VSALVDAIFAAANADDVALVDGERSLTYRELNDEIVRRCEKLSSFEPGERVAIACQTTASTLACYLATLRAGLVAVPVPPALPPARLQAILDDVGARLLITDPELFQATDSLSFAAPGPTPELAVLQLTSGSTRTAIAVEVTEAQLLANARAIAAALSLTRDDRALLVLPWHYCYGASVIHSHLLVGSTVVLGPRPALPADVARMLADQHITSFYGVPLTYTTLLRSSDFATRELPALRRLAAAGGALDARTVEALDASRAIAGGAKLYIMYGQTEATARLSILSPDERAAHPGSVGKGLADGTRLVVKRDDHSDAALAEEGEVFATGPAIANGYWRRRDETANKFAHGGLWTGDRGIADADGYVYLRGRAGDFVKVGGMRVAPAEVEEVLCKLDGVVEAAVDGVPDALLGHVLRAHVVLLPGTKLDAASIITSCRAVLEPEKVPRRIEIVDALPRTASGKLARSELGQ